jgi:hypothetical protein
LISFLNYYRRYIESFSEITASLMKLIKKNVLFTYSTKQREAIKKFKKKFTEVSIQAIFDPELKAILETNISNYAIEAYLTQKIIQRIRIIAFYFRKITKPKLNYDIHDKELLAIVETLKE